MANLTLDQIKNEVRQRISCVSYLEKARGSGYCCPKCNSGHGSNGSGAVKYYQDTNTWYCHKCRAGGDVIDLYQAQTGTGFMDALRELARTIGIDAEQAHSGKTQRKGEETQRSKKTAQNATSGPTAYIPDPDINNEIALYVQDTQEVFLTIGPISQLAIQSAGGEAVAFNRPDAAYKLLEKLKDHPTKAAVIIAFGDDGDEDTAKASQALIDGLDALGVAVIKADIIGQYEDAGAALERDKAAFVQAVENAKQAARERQAALATQLLSGPAMVDAFLETIQTRKYEPIPTGIADLDRALGGGFMRQQLVLLGAAPGAGKTALAAWIFEGMAKKGTDCLFLNLEMSREQLLARSIARIARSNGDKVTPAEILQGYRWTENQREAVAVAAQEYKEGIAQHLLYNPDGLTAQLDSILEYAEREAAKKEATGAPAPLLVVDYLQVIEGGAREDKVDLIQRAVKGLKAFAIKHNTIVFAIMAQNREANKAGVSDIGSGRDTSNLEYGADLLLGLDYTGCLDRPGHPAKARSQLTDEELNRKTLRVLKSRFSATGMEIDLYFSGESAAFDLLAKEEPTVNQRWSSVKII